MSLIKQLLPQPTKAAADLLEPAVKFTPASAEVDWTRVETLVHGPGAGEDKRTINSAVFSCLMALSNSYPEPPLVVKRKYRRGDTAARSDHPLQKLLDAPTPEDELSMEEMLFWTAWAKHIDGNAYWMKVRSGNEETGNVVELWPVSPTMIEPITVRGSDDWISYYKYHDAPNHYVAVPKANIIHFRLGLDDRDMRKGLAPLKSLVRQIATDDEADKFVAALLKNYAIPGLVVVPTQASGSITSDEADKMTAKLRQKFGNDNRGNIAVLSKESKIEQFGFSPDDLDMSILHRIPEERISAVIGVPAIVAGLGAGLDRATYANFKEAREMFTEQKLIPMWRTDAAKLNTSLLPDFDSTRNMFIEFDITNVRALQEDEDNKYKRLELAVGGKPWMTRNEARTEIGMDPIEGWDDEDIKPPAPDPEPETVPEQLQPETPEELTETQKVLNGWRKRLIRAFRSGKPLDNERPPSKRLVSPVLVAAIQGALENVKTAEELYNIFEDVWIGYP